MTYLPKLGMGALLLITPALTLTPAFADGAARADGHAPIGVMGDHRTYDNVCALRAVTSTDGMTADIYPFDSHFLSSVATRIVNEVKGINRVVYDYTSKPPGTIEWE